MRRRNKTIETDQRRRLVQLINKYRVENGLNQLGIDGRLWLSAQAKSDHMRNEGYFAHGSPDGLWPDHFLSEAAYNFSTYYENIAWNTTTADASLPFNQWMTSTKGHNEAMLAESIKDIGIGLAVKLEARSVNGFCFYWTFHGATAVY